MITEEVINEIYKNYNKPCKHEEELKLPYFVDLLKEHHRINIEGDDVVIESMEEFSPFRRFLKRGLYAVLEFDKNVAFVFRAHILFFSKNSSKLTVHIRPVEKKSLLGRLFGRK